MTIPTILFTTGLFVYAIGAFFVWYHLTRFGIGAAPKLAFMIFAVGSVILIGTAIVLFRGISWYDNIQMLNFPTAL